MRIAALVLAWLLSAAAGAAAAEIARTPPPFPAVPPTEPKPPQAVKAYVPVEPPQPPRAAHAEAARPPRGRTCFSQSDARDKIAQHRLADPMGALRAGRSQGEALRARLCRWKPDEFVYEVYVLRHDGHVVKLYVDARNGETVGALGETPPVH